MDDLPPMAEIQSRRTYLLYKKAEYLTTPQEDDELDYLNKTLDEWDAFKEQYGCA